MSRILVTGGTGLLGRELVPRLVAAGFTTRVMSRSPHDGGNVEWAQADLATGAGVDTALEGVDTVIHAAHTPSKDVFTVDVEGGQRFLKHVRAAGVGHFIYISIVGVDRVPYNYYRAKLAVEQLVRESGVPWSIQRATQFHPFVDMLLGKANHRLILALPTEVQVQPIDTGEVAARLVDIATNGSGGTFPHMGGPQVLNLGEISRSWLAARGQRRRIIHLPVPGKFVAALRAGELTCSSQRVGTISWQDWLGQMYSKPAVATAHA